jgi:anti-sigma B factor antagonist
VDNIKISLLENPSDDVSEVRVDGVIDTITATELEDIIDTLMKRSRYKVIVDLAGVDYVSSAGWGIFISHIRDVRAKGGDIKLANMIPNVYEIYDLLEFDNVIKAFSSVDEARNDFGSPAAGGLKKKDREVTGVTVIDQVTAPGIGYSSGRTVSSETEIEADSTDVDVMVIRLVKNDPFASISEMKSEINLRRRDGAVSWWQVFSALRRKGLLTRRSRFRFVRGR